MNTVGAAAPKGTDSASAAPLDPAKPCQAPRRWRRRLLLTIVFAAAIVACHGIILRGLAGFLVVDDPLEPTQAVVLIGESGPYQAIPVDEAAELCQKGLANEVFLIEDRSSRIVQAGVVPTVEAVVRKELVKHGVPLKVLTVWAGEYRFIAKEAEPLRHWLKAHPGGHVTVLWDQFDSRRGAYVMKAELGPELAQRVHWRALPDQRRDVSNWWHSRHGVIAVFSSYVSLFHAYLVGEPSDLPTRWNPDDFEQELRHGIVAP